MTSLLGDFLVTWGRVTSFPVTLLPPPASYSLVGSEITVYASLRFYTATSRWLPIKWRHFWVCFGHFRSREVISCHMTAFSCKLQPCRKWNAQYTAGFGLLQPLPGNFQSNDVTCGSLPVTWGHGTSFLVA